MSKILTTILLMLIFSVSVSADMRFKIVKSCENHVYKYLQYNNRSAGQFNYIRMQCCECGFSVRICLTKKEYIDVMSHSESIKEDYVICLDKSDFTAEDYK